MLFIPPDSTTNAGPVSPEQRRRGSTATVDVNALAPSSPEGFPTVHDDVRRLGAAVASTDCQPPNR